MSDTHEPVPADERLAQTEALLTEARKVLERYWFEGSYNNYDVINISEKIDAYFRGDDPLEVAQS